MKLVIDYVEDSWPIGWETKIILIDDKGNKRDYATNWTESGVELDDFIDELIEIRDSFLLLNE